MTHCTRCVLPDSFPNISFDNRGVCNFCSAIEGENRETEQENYRKRFTELIEQCRGKEEYDCTVSYSGGKDSTYTLYLMREVYKLNVLALTFDNGFLSDEAFHNIRTVTERLGVDSIVYKPDFSLLKKIFVAGMDRQLYSAKTLERASTICTSCIGLAKFSLMKIALERRVPIMTWGWTPGQAPIRSSIMKINAALFHSMQEALRKPMMEIAGQGINRCFIAEEQFTHPERFPYNASPLAFLDYNEHEVLATIKKLGWKSPNKLDANSTNCLLNSFANQKHVEKYGFHPYAFEIAGLVRIGVMTRDEGMSKLDEMVNDSTVSFVKDKLGL